MHSKILFVVVDENSLCYVDPRLPKWAKVLCSSIVRGATRTWMDGPFPLPVDGKGVRPATVRDFETYRISPEPYQRDVAHYEPLAA